MTDKQFAARAEISLSLAYQLIAEGRVPHRRIGGAGREARSASPRRIMSSSWRAPRPRRCKRKAA